MCVQTYHTAADRLQLIPATAKYAGGVQYEVHLDRTGATAADIVTADLKVSLPPLGVPPKQLLTAQLGCHVASQRGMGVSCMLSLLMSCCVEWPQDTPGHQKAIVAAATHFCSIYSL